MQFERNTKARDGRIKEPRIRPMAGAYGDNSAQLPRFRIATTPFLIATRRNRIRRNPHTTNHFTFSTRNKNAYFTNAQNVLKSAPAGAVVDAVKRAFAQASPRVFAPAFVGADEARLPREARPLPRLSWMPIPRRSGRLGFSSPRIDPKLAGHTNSARIPNRNSRPNAQIQIADPKFLIDSHPQLKIAATRTKQTPKLFLIDSKTARFRIPRPPARTDARPRPPRFRRFIPLR
jgi:hypothetical protein